MLLLESQDVVGQTAYWEDDQNPLQYYALPGEPTLAIRDGKAVFRFVKYRNPIDRPGGVKGGGLIVMQAELALPQKDEIEIRRRIEQRLQALRIPPAQASNVKIGRPVITRGKVNVSVLGESGNQLVQKVIVPSPPSLYGNNAVSIGVELNEFGAPVFEAALKGQGAALVIVGYELGYSAKLPKAHIVGTWDASSFQHFKQEINEEWSYWHEDDYEEKITDYLHKSETQKLEWILQPPAAGMDAAAHQKMLDMIEDSVRRQLDEGIKRNVLEVLPPENRDVQKLRDRGLEDITRTIDNTRISSVRVEYEAAKVVEMSANPNAPLPSLGSVVVNGKALKWDDYAITIDADDPFFKSFAASFMVNADFADLPIASVIAQVSYKGRTGEGASKTFTFRKPEDLYRFEAFYDGGDGEFSYTYTVNYKGESQAYKSPPLKSRSDISINVGALGIWKVDIETGDINFEEVEQALVSCHYKDGTVNLERQFTITQDKPSHRIREVIFKPLSQPWTYKLKFIMKGGREISVAEGKSETDRLYVNDPFSAKRTISIRTKGDFETVIDQLFLDLEYDDSQNNYRQTQSFAFSQDGMRFTDWSFPVINEKQGTLKYRGQIVYRDGRPPLEISEKKVDGNSVLEGEDVLQLRVELLADLLDWELLKLVMVTLSYDDQQHNISESDTLRIVAESTELKWIVNIKDRSKNTYGVKAKFFFKDGTRKESSFQSSEESLLLEPPA